MHECPQCGAQTEGAYSEAGIRWSICESCMQKDLPAQKIGRRENVSEWIYDLDPEENS